MKKKLPRDLPICHPTYIDKVNSGTIKPSLKMCGKIIAAMEARGEKLTYFDLRPDLKEMVMDSL